MIRTNWMKQSRQENITYLVVWGLLFAAPLLTLYVRTISDGNIMFDWKGAFIVWQRITVYLLLFLIHNFLMAPLFFDKSSGKGERVVGRKRLTYFSIVIVILIAFTAFQLSYRPEGIPPHPFPPGNGPVMDPPPPHMVRDHDILAIVMLILMFGANLGIKGYFRGLEDSRRLAELERKNLEQQLDYLRYQINPHFFMNTLNNIHALVDIDSEKAKDTIVELSRMMRFVLYEGNKQSVPLTRELDFIRHYVALMELRYTDNVHIYIDLPHEVPDRYIPPLILITFIENAFKHGISYKHESFVEAKVTVEEEQLRFTCINSKTEASPDSPEGEDSGGVGLTNVRKRLNLLYGQNYALRIRNEADIYSVELTIPLS